MSERVDPFTTLNLDEFKPKPKPAVPEKQRKEIVDRVAEENGFPSRSPAKKQVAAPVEAAPERTRRRFVTGRNQQINVKATDATIQKFYRLADAQNVPLGELLERALTALETQLATIELPGSY